MELYLVDITKGYQGKYYREIYKYSYKSFTVMIMTFNHKIGSITIKDNYENVRVSLTEDSYRIYPDCIIRDNFEKSVQKILDARDLCEYLLLHKNDLIKSE